MEFSSAKEAKGTRPSQEPLGLVTGRNGMSRKQYYRLYVSFTMFDNFDRDGYAPTSGKNANGRSLLRLIWRIR